MTEYFRHATAGLRRQTTIISKTSNQYVFDLSDVFYDLKIKHAEIPSANTVTRVFDNTKTLDPFNDSKINVFDSKLNVLYTAGNDAEKTFVFSRATNICDIIVPTTCVQSVIDSDITTFNFVVNDQSPKCVALCKYCNISKDLFDKLEIPYVFTIKDQKYNIDCDPIDYLETDDRKSHTSWGQRLDYIEQHGIDTILIRAIVINGQLHLRLVDQHVDNYLDWLYAKMTGLSVIPVCIICSDVTTLDELYNYNPVDIDEVNQYLQPEIRLDTTVWN